jgi:hypothetical protein
MKSIGSLMVILGLAAIVFGFMERVPRILAWIYEWGDGAAWGIKIGLIVIGGVIYYLAGRSKKDDSQNPS